MKKSELEATIEAFAAEEHKQWAAWAMEIMNTEVISSTRAARWIELIQTDYEDLSEEMKELDRKEVRTHVLPIIESLMQENQALNEFRLAVAHVLMRPDWCSLESLARYAKEDIEYLRKENLKLNEQLDKLKEQIIMYKRSFEVGDDR